MIALGVIVLHLRLPACLSLKEKRGKITPLLNRLNRHLKLSTSEIDRQDHWQEAIIACALVSNDQIHNQQVLQNVPGFIQKYFLDIEVVDSKIELI